MTTTPSAPRPARRRGRPSRASLVDGEPGTRERILTSACEEFAERGYDRASIRAIARGAEVDSALVHHYFGTKEQVFSAAVAAAARPVTQGLSTVLAGDAHQLGERITRFFFRIWENPATRAPMLAVLRSGLHNETAARLFRRCVTQELMGHITSRIEASDAQLRVELAVAQLVGVSMLRYVLEVPPLASAPVDDIIARLTPVVQEHLTGSAH